MKDGRASQARPVRAIDWPAVHARVQRLAERLAAPVARDAEETRRVLAARTAAFARPPAGTAADANLPLLVFGFGGQRYGLEPAHVRGVFRTPPVTALPGAPAFVRGMAAARGRVVAVLELPALWGGTLATAPAAHLLVLEREAVAVGLLAEAVEGVARVALPLLAPPAGARGAEARCLRGLTGEGLVVLDGARLLEDPRLAGIGKGGA